jgi:hypothetical protein
MLMVVDGRRRLAGEAENLTGRHLGVDAAYRLDSASAATFLTRRLAPARE